MNDGYGILDAIGTIGNVLDTPGSLLRGLLAGQPKRALAGILDTEQRVGGREMLEDWGVLGPNQEGLDVGDVAGFGAEILADPVELLLGGAFGLKALAKGKALTHNAKAAKLLASGGMPEAIARTTKAAEAGQPLRLFHGTPRVFDKYDLTHDNGANLFGRGVYGSTSPDVTGGIMETARQRGMDWDTVVHDAREIAAGSMSHNESLLRDLEYTTKLASGEIGLDEYLRLAKEKFPDIPDAASSGPSRFPDLPSAYSYARKVSKKTNQDWRPWKLAGDQGYEVLGPEHLANQRIKMHGYTLREGMPDTVSNFSLIPGREEDLVDIASREARSIREQTGATRAEKLEKAIQEKDYDSIIENLYLFPGAADDMEGDIRGVLRETTAPVPQNLRMHYVNTQKPFDVEQAISKSELAKLLLKADRRTRREIVEAIRSPGYEDALDNSLDGVTPRHMPLKRLVDVYKPTGDDVWHAIAAAQPEPNDLLQRAGYDSITHTGGQRMGSVMGYDPHQVYIALDPKDVYSPWVAPDAKAVPKLSPIVAAMLAQAGVPRMTPRKERLPEELLDAILTPQ